MIDELDRLIEQARALPPMTEEQLRAQCISFAYGNCMLDGCNVTRDLVTAEYDRAIGVFDGAGIA